MEKQNEIHKLGTIAIVLSTVILSQLLLNTPIALAQSEDEIPTLKCIINNHEYMMIPTIHSSEGSVKTINSPELPDEVQPAFKVGVGEKMSMEFSEKPTSVSVFLVDYDADTPQVTPQKVTDIENAELVGPPGIRNLEVRAIYPNGEYTTYTKLIEII